MNISEQIQLECEIDACLSILGTIDVNEPNVWQPLEGSVKWEGLEITYSYSGMFKEPEYKGSRDEPSDGNDYYTEDVTVESIESI